MIKSRFVPRIAEFTRKASDEQILGTGLIVSGLATSAGALAIDAFVGNETLTSLVTVGGLGAAAVGGAVLGIEKVLRR